MGSTNNNVRHFFKSAVGRSSLTTPPSHKPDNTNLAVMDLPSEILCQVFEHIIAPFKEYYDDNLVPQYFRGRGIRFQVVESSFSHESPSSTDNLTVTGEVSIRNLNQMVATRQAVDPLATYREIESGTAETIPDGWLQSEGVAQQLEQLSWDEDEMTEEDTDDYSDSDESSDDESSDDDTADNGEDVAAFVPRASSRRLVLDRDPVCDPDGAKRAFLATNRRDDASCIKSSPSGEPSSKGSAQSSTPTPSKVSTPATPLLRSAIAIPESSSLATAEDGKDAEHLDSPIFDDDDDDEYSDPLEYVDYDFVMVYRPHIWETDEEIVALETPRRACPHSTAYEPRCRFRSPHQYQNLLRLSQLSPGVTKELGKTLYPNCTAEFPYGPHLFPVFAAERPAILPMIRGIILHLDCSADFNDTITTELAHMLSFFSPSLRPDSPCRKLAFLTVKLRTSLVDIPRWPQENVEVPLTEKQLIMDKLREWGPLFRAVHTDEFLLRLVGIRHEVCSAAQGVPYGMGQEDWEREVTNREIMAMWRYAGLLE
ncbi:uncharacterized protein B0T23DRAFT_408487 [Neurospora hispaniola]|uniref:Uncharacterized protein n=1 Tax=Neurospora hispaniola TaxID=588809 RepID=A0AAJ0HZ77_9PEZI|nr:hypothetical protein B0T23DRAFT_408487 [Neurospora hispaniola]